MYAHLKGVSLLIALLALVLSSIFLLAENTQEGPVGGQLEDGLTVSGSTGKPSGYESIGQLQMNAERTSYELSHTTLSDFLESRTSSTMTQDEYDTKSSSSFFLDEAAVALKRYGNSVGTTIQDRLDSGRDESAVLNSFITNPKDTTSRQAMKLLADDYAATADSLLSITPPETVADMHKNLIQAYLSIAGGMNALLLSAVSVDDLLAYNNTLTPFIDAYMNLAQTFRVYGIVFNESEPGLIFNLPF
ncbi:MAG: hypothetical protein OQJ98_03155 [Candidatus Pacebacteria bacterium]|nr:hypothetical protein [Candidatus Paceibacterota bacterium]